MNQPTGGVMLPRMLEGSLDHSLRFAIAHRRLIQLTYSGAVRIAEPHDYGVHKGRVRLLVYQQSSSGSGAPSRARGWRLLDVDEIEQCEVQSQSFSGSRGHQHQHHYAWDVVYARVE